MWDDLNDPFPNFSGANLGMGKHFHPTLYCACDYSSMLGLKSNHVSKGGPCGEDFEGNW